MRRTVVGLLVAAVLLPAPAKAYDFIWDCRGPVVWDHSNVTFEPSLVSFPNGSAWQASVEGMRTIWNNEVPGGNYRIQYVWSPNANWATSDGRNSVVMAAPADWVWGPETLAVTLSRRSTCNWWPFARAELREADILFNPNPVTPFGFPTFWDTAVNPAPPLFQGPYNSTLVGIHEHGHAFGLNHENDLLATMNAFYPDGGVIGNNNESQPHSDDTYADRVGYGTVFSSLDLAASAYRRTGAGQSAEIPAPAVADRAARVTFPFTIENRGTAHQTGVAVRYYLSPDRFITTADTLLGSATFNLNAGVTLTATAFVTIPAAAPVGTAFLGWIVDPLNLVPESDEGNNGVALVNPTMVRANRAPQACFTANPTSGMAPLPVTFTSCSSDPDGDPLTYEWNFGDGGTSTLANPFHLFFTAGFYGVTLTVRDPSGATSVAFGNIAVICESPNGQEICPRSPDPP